MGLENLTLDAMPDELNEEWPLYKDPLGRADDHIRNIKMVVKNMFAGLIGVPLPKLDNQALDPMFRLFDGSAIDVAVDPILYAKYGENMPNLYGRSLAGVKETGETIGTEIASQNVEHTHESTSAATDLGTVQTENKSLQFITTVYDIFSYNGSGNIGGASSQAHMNPRAAASNVVAHGHDIILGEHDHDLVVENEGGAEVRVESTLCAWYCFRG